MKSLWNEADAQAAIGHYAGKGVSEDLALRTYSARLLGRDPTLVLHGGGNTSVKTTTTDLFGDDVEVLCVKGSGWDLGAIEPAGHPAVRLAPLLRLRQLDRLSDEDMVNAQRQNLMDSTAPNPSVETLLHAFLPDKFIDHTHSTAVLAIADQPDAEAIIAELMGAKVACVPYVMPGFELAQLAVETYERSPGIQGMVLLKHGIFSFGATARESYERMIALVTLAEDFIRSKPSTRRPAPSFTGTPLRAAEILPTLRGLLSHTADGRWPSHWIADLRGEEETLDLVGDPRLGEWALRGVATPDHVIRTKAGPVVLPPAVGDLADWRADAEEALEAFKAQYNHYVHVNMHRVGGKTPLDPLPRVAAIPGLGLVGLGKSFGEASVAADIAQSWAATLLAAESVGRFEPVDEADTFDMEYWSLEQAKLGKASDKRLQRRIVAITGGAGAIGMATARAFAAEGAEVALLDIDEDAVRIAATEIGGQVRGFGCDVTDPFSVVYAFDEIAARFGGLDILVSNAGSATTGAMAAMDDAALRASFDLNFFGHQNVAKAAVAILRRQGMGGTLLFNVSKQALNPGPDFGAYGTSKAALLALVRQYALEHGAEGIRVNALNPDRIRSGLLTDEMIASRAASRGLSEDAYMAGNLLGEEVTADDVAQAFVFAALMRKTTGAVITVDGGNVAAMVR